MQLALSGLSALQAWRTIRARKVPVAQFAHVELAVPSPSPAQRWTRRALALDGLGLEDQPNEKRPLHVAVPSPETRIRMRGITSTVYSRLPEGSFVDVGNGVQLACPELVFAEAAAQMQPAVLALLGMELCGGYSRDAANPRSGHVTFGAEPLTTPEKIAAFLDEARYLRSAKAAREMLPFVMENAWSPMESVIALLSRLDTDRLGYGLEGVELNPRIETANRGTRVPDILFAGTHVGLNYDGAGHFETDDDAPAPSRDKMLSDKQRDRDLAVAGYTVLPATIEDLREDGGLDRVMSMVVKLVEDETGQELAETRRTLADPLDRSRRQRLIWSLLPGERGRHILSGDHADKLGDVMNFEEELVF